MGGGRYRSSGHDAVSLRLDVPPVVLFVQTVLDHRDSEVPLPVVFREAFHPGKVSSCRQVEQRKLDVTAVSQGFLHNRFYTSFDESVAPRIVR